MYLFNILNLWSSFRTSNREFKMRNDENMRKAVHANSFFVEPRLSQLKLQDKSGHVLFSSLPY